MEKIKIKDEYIRLDSLLKYVGVALTGGQAKLLIKSGNVRVNGEICEIRGKKIRSGNIIEVDGKEYEVQVDCT